MIAGTLTDEQDKALERLRSRAEVRVHRIKDEPPTARTEVGRFVSTSAEQATPPAVQPPLGKRALKRQRMIAAITPGLTEIPARTPKRAYRAEKPLPMPQVEVGWVLAKDKPRKRHPYNCRSFGVTASVRAALQGAGEEGLTVRQVCAITGTESGATGRSLREMRDVLINRADGLKRYRYKLAAPVEPPHAPLVVPTLADWWAANKGRPLSPSERKIVTRLKGQL